MLTDQVRAFIKKKLAIVSDQNIDEHPLGNGRSGAEVYSIRVRSRRPSVSGCYIVKICSTLDERDDNEANKARKLYDYAPKFSKHLVKVVAAERIDEKNVIIYSQANESPLFSVAFSQMDASHMAEHARIVSHDLLSLLNEDPEINGTMEDFFRCLLTKQIGENGRFTSRLEALLDRPQAECIAINGSVYPNPLSFVKNMAKWSSYIPNIFMLKGAIHGDLHGFNILALNDTYSIIDFDSTNIDSYLFFDHAYFEFSVFYDNSKDNDLKRWDAMLKQLISPSIFQEAEPCEHYLEYMVRNAVCGGIVDWINEAEREKLRDDIEIQFLMARIAAGINFFSKKTCSDYGKQLKVLLYISHCLELLSDKIGYTCDKNDISTIKLPVEFIDIEDIWENILKFTNYVSILITDDLYLQSDLSQLQLINGFQWSLVMDIGLETKDPIIYKSILENKKSDTVKRVNLLLGESVETYLRTLNILSIRKPYDISYYMLWLNYRKQIEKCIEKLLSANPQVPLVLVFDCGKDSLPFRDHLINSLCEMTLPAASRFVALRTHFSDSFHRDQKDLENARHWCFVEHIDATLVHIAQSCKCYLNETNCIERQVNLPKVEGIYSVSEEDLISFESSIELVYSGCEYATDNENLHVGFDLSGGGDSLGEAFYKGNEASWSDIAHHRDLQLLENHKYQRVLKRLRDLMDETSPRVQKVKLIHGAGTGGTTLSKRILWDLKDIFPCARLKKYSSKTVNILLELYKKTGKRILLTVEQGSTVITDDEINILTQKINAENGKLLLLSIARSNESRNLTSTNPEENSNVIVRLPDTMPVSIALDFKSVFSAFAVSKRDSLQRIKLLEMITGDNMQTQRSPFFYGFYTFQEEYNLISNLRHTVSECNLEEKTLLSCLALVTTFSQNICVAFSELPVILEKANADNLLNIYFWIEKLPTALSKLTVIRNNGLRICHQVIAERIMTILHSPEENADSNFRNAIYQATIDYINILSRIYDTNNERVDAVLKELIIDRAYIDADTQKTKFSPLVESIPLWTDRKKLFETLVSKFPQNPHYYNHLARLLAYGDNTHTILPQYEEAVEQAKKAIDIAIDAEIAVTSHRTTLGCIYGQWIIHDIKSEIRNKKDGRLSYSYKQLIESFSLRYSLARAEFEASRESAEIHDSFCYFPQINLECEIIRHLIQFDLDRSLRQLLDQEPEFSLWYNEHLSIAVELASKMDERVENSKSFQNEAHQKLLSISPDSTHNLLIQLNSLLQSNEPVDIRRRRALTYAAFVTNGCNWNKLERNALEIAEQCFRKNIMEASDSHKSSDIETWFELYRRTRYFQASEAQHILVDYMENGYRKEYLLSLIAFILLEAKSAGSSVSAVTSRINEAQRLARLHGINTVREYDFFVNSDVTGCPIMSMADVPRNAHGEPTGLKMFTGVVTEVEHTHGKILLDQLNIEVTFIPNPTSVTSDPKRVFTRSDLSQPVALNLMFSYSGLRGWNVVKTH